MSYPRLVAISDRRPPTRIGEWQATARAALLGARTPDGRWEGRLSTSALSTATAVIALAVAKGDTRSLVERGAAWLAAHANADGGWGDTPESRSNISTTALGWGAIASAVCLFLLSFRRAGERAGRMAERLETMERSNEVHRRMLEAAAPRHELSSTRSSN